MKSKISLAFVLIVCSLLLFVLLTRKVSAQHPTPKPTPTPTPAASDLPVPPVVVNPCCGTKPPFKGIPNYSASTYATFTGQIAVATNFADASTKPSVVIWDLKNQATAPKNVQWTTTSAPSTNYYSHNAWTRNDLGDVFGLTLDSQGNIYVAATRVYNSNNVAGSGGAVGAGGHGDIYKLDANTGTPSRIVQTDVTATYAGNHKLPNTGPGLGNIHYNCKYDRLYATNFEDGMIYCINLQSHQVEAVWDHGHNLPTANPPATRIDDDGTNGFTPLGRRPWAVQEYNGRLYYSIWWTDGGPPAGGPYNNPHNPTHPTNEIWSVGLDNSGHFSGPAKLEIILSAFQASPQFSNPASDISFGPSGQMLVAERTMTSDVSSYAHSSRVLEYKWNGASWVPTPNSYKIGAIQTQTNAAGGCDYDWGSPGFMWATGDALHFPVPFIYGLQGTPTSGSPLDVTNSVLIDLNNDVSNMDKTWIGDVEIPCPPASPTPTPEPCAAAVKEITCKKDGSGYSVNLVVTNNTGQPVIDVLLASPPGSNYTVAPAHAGPLANHASINVAVTITGGKPGEKVCFTVTFMGKDGCLCTIEVCTVLPDCCVILNSDATQIVCNKDGTYTYTTVVTNNSGSPIQSIYLYPQAGATMTPDYFTMTQPLQPGKTFTLSTTISGVKSGEVCFDISLHTEGMKNCCTSPKHCITLLECK